MEQVIKEYDQEFDEEFELVLSQMGKITHKDKWCLIKWFRRCSEETQKSIREHMMTDQIGIWKSVYFCGFSQLFKQKKLIQTKSHIEQIKEFSKKYLLRIDGSKLQEWINENQDQ